MGLSIQGRVSFPLAVLVLVATASSAWAQAGTASVYGDIKDQQGAALPGATVTLTNAGTGATRATTTNEIGSLPVRGPDARYSTRSRSSLTGFRTAVHDKLELAVDTATRLDVVAGARERVGDDRSGGQVVDSSTRPTRASATTMTGQADSAASARSAQPGRSAQPAGRRRLSADRRSAAADRSAARAAISRTSRSTASTSTTRSAGLRLHHRGARDARLAAGVPRQHEQLQRRHGPLERRAGVAGHQERHEPASRRRLLGRTATPTGRATSTSSS